MENLTKKPLNENQETRIINKIYKRIFEFLPILLMLFVQAFLSPEFVSFTNRDYCISLVQIIVVDTSISLCFSKRINIEEITVVTYILIFLASSVLYVLLQINVIEENKTLCVYISIGIMFIVSSVLKIVGRDKKAVE